MAFRVGDTVFSPSGSPSVVVGRDEAKSTLKVDQDFKAFQVATRHGLINGLAPESREQFNAIMDEVMSDSDNSERVGFLQSKIEELKVDPKNTKLVQYLEGEVRHLMNIKGIKPRFYNTEEGKVR
jgi:hypothetical protein